MVLGVCVFFLGGGCIKLNTSTKINQCKNAAGMTMRASCKAERRTKYSIVKYAREKTVTSDTKNISSAETEDGN